MEDATVINIEKQHNLQSWNISQYDIVIPGSDIVLCMSLAGSLPISNKAPELSDLRWDARISESRLDIESVTTSLTNNNQIKLYYAFTM